MKTLKPNKCSSCEKEYCPKLVNGLCTKCYARTKKKYCSHPGCHFVASTVGLCKTHHKQAVEAGEMVIIPKGIINYCKIDGCDKRVSGHGLCFNHYRQEYRKNKYPTKPKPPAKTPSKRSKYMKEWGEKLSNSLEEKREFILKDSMPIRKEDVITYTLDAYILAGHAKISVSSLQMLLKNLKEDEQIIDFTYDKKLKIVKVMINLENEIKLNNIWNQSFEFSEEKSIDESL